MTSIITLNIAATAADSCVPDNASTVDFNLMHDDTRVCGVTVVVGHDTFPKVYAGSTETWCDDPNSLGELYRTLAIESMSEEDASDEAFIFERAITLAEEAVEDAAHTLLGHWCGDKWLQGRPNGGAPCTGFRSN